MGSAETDMVAEKERINNRFEAREKDISELCRRIVFLTDRVKTLEHAESDRERSLSESICRLEEHFGGGGDAMTMQEEFKNRLVNPENSGITARTHIHSRLKTLEERSRSVDDVFRKIAEHLGDIERCVEDRSKLSNGGQFGYFKHLDGSDI